MSPSFQETLDKLDATHRRRQLRTCDSPVPPFLQVDGKRAVNFCTNDYLGLSQHPVLLHAAHHALDEYGLGSGSARLITGTSQHHTDLESAVAQWKGTESALVFNSGYQANVGVLSGLVTRHDLIFADALNHASLIDGALLSRGRFVRYPHNDMTALRGRLEQEPCPGQRFIVTDSVFSMDGDLAPLAELHALATEFNAWLIIDEAHGTGIFGETHRSGLWETTGIGPAANVIQIGTFSKALGSFGAYVAASEEVIAMLINHSRSFVYSTALPPAIMAANLAALHVIQTDSDPYHTLWENIQTFREAVIQHGLSINPVSPIIPLVLGDSDEALATAAKLLHQGFYVQAIRPPTVPENTARLRISLSALHTAEQLSALAKALAG